jgi:hypothetical protein
MTAHQNWNRLVPHGLVVYHSHSTDREWELYVQDLIDRRVRGNTPFTDLRGNELPFALDVSFATLEKFQEVQSLCRHLQKLLDEMSRLPGGEVLGTFLQPTRVGDEIINTSKELNNLQFDLQFSRPYSVCPYCVDRLKRGCESCSGAGWLNELGWGSLPELVKEDMV